MGTKRKNKFWSFFKRKQKNVDFCVEIEMDDLDPDWELNNDEEPELTTWLNKNRPLKTILNFKSRFDWVAVLHPRYDLLKFQSQTNRVNDIPWEVRMMIKACKSTIQHGDLLTLAVENGVMEGLWLLYFDNPYAWDNYFLYLAVALYRQALTEEDFHFLKVEAVWDYEKRRGAVMLFNENFTDLEMVNRLGIICRQTLKILKIKEFHTSTLCYRPQFYMDVSLRFNFYNFRKSHIFIKNFFEPVDGIFKYDVGVEEWFIKHNIDQKKFETKYSEIDFYGSL